VAGRASGLSQRVCEIPHAPNRGSCKSMYRQKCIWWNGYSPWLPYRRSMSGGHEPDRLVIRVRTPMQGRFRPKVSSY
jgi:hypothetical protein